MAETFTFLLTDIEGSTSLWERFPEEMRAALKLHDALLHAAIEAAGGHVVKSTGDGTFAVFGNTTAALGAIVAAQRNLATASWPGTGALRVRMGLHTGQAEQRANDFFGPTVNRVARIMGAGHGGQVLLSAAAASLAAESLPAGASLLDLGEHRLRGIDRAERIFQLVHPDLTSQFPPLTTVRLMAANLPSRATVFVGRQAESRQIEERLKDPATRLLTLTGPGGTGKTALAIRVGEALAPDFPDGMCFVDLSNTGDSNAVLVAVARAIGLEESVGKPLPEEIARFLRDRRALIVLDNFEQVAEAAGAVARLLADCPRLRVLATSREALHVRGEQVFHVAPLALPPAGSKLTVEQLKNCDAVQLFLDRARAVRPGFDLTDENAATVAEICRRLDGLPLAIELAAPRLRLLSLEALRKQLHSRLTVLGGGPRDLPARQQTLRAAIDWSYALLDPNERRLFELLSVFADADLAAVESVERDAGAGDFDVLETLTGLIDKSLVRQADPHAAYPRVTMLETIREFAADRLMQRADIRERAVRAHARFYTDLAAERMQDMADDDHALEAMAIEIGNLRIAWDYWIAAGDLKQLERLARRLVALNDSRGWYLDIVRLAQDMLAVLERAPAAEDRIVREIALRTILARALMVTQGFTPEVEKAYVGAVELFERGNDVDFRQKFTVLRGLYSLYQLTAEPTKTEMIGRELLALADREKDPRLMIDASLAVASQVLFADPTKGVEQLEFAISLFPQVSDRAFSMRGPANDPRVSTLTTAAFGLWFVGHPDRAVDRANQALELAAKLSHPFTSAYAHFHVGLLRTLRREFDFARERAVHAQRIGEEHGLQIWNAVGSFLAGVAETALGREEEGIANIGAGMERYRGLRSPPVFLPILYLLSATAYQRAGRAADGLRQIEAGEAGAARMGVLNTEFQIAKGDIVSALAAGSLEQPEPIYRAAHDLARSLNARLPQLRAATRLARDLGARGHADAVIETLGPLYATFDEGLETADLREARDVLAAASPVRYPPGAG